MKANPMTATNRPRQGRTSGNTPSPFLDYYIENGISPVTQDISDIQKHFRRREALYRHLGIPPSYVRGKNIIEFGFGNGHNALYTLRLNPGSYKMVDANPLAFDNTDTLLKEHGASGYVFEQCRIEEYQDSRRYDLVLCEGVIPGQRTPESFTRKVAGLVAPGGILVITSLDATSFLSELLRRVIGCMLTRDCKSLDESVEKLLPVFSPHLATLKGMSRSHEQWIMDAIVQPLHGRLFSIPEALDALSEEFDIYHSSPHFLSDWRWYKDIHAQDPGFNTLALTSYMENAHNFLDYRYQHPPGCAEANKKITSCCNEIFMNIIQFENTNDTGALDRICELTSYIADSLMEHALETALALRNFVEGIGEYHRSNTFGELKLFAPPLWKRTNLLVIHP